MTDPASQQQPGAQQPGYPQYQDQQYTAPQYPAQQYNPQYPAQQQYPAQPQYPAQQYPAQPQQPLPPRPNTLTAACAICFVGGAIDVIALIVESSNNLGGGQVAGSLIGAALWFLVGGFCLRGQQWARITGTVLFGLNCLLTILLVVGIADAISIINQANSGTAFLFSSVASIGTSILYLLMVIVIALWLMGLAATILLWRSESSAYFNLVSAQTQAPNWQAPAQMPQQQMPQQQQWPQQ